MKSITFHLYCLPTNGASGTTHIRYTKFIPNNKNDLFTVSDPWVGGASAHFPVDIMRVKSLGDKTRPVYPAVPPVGGVLNGNANGYHYFKFHFKINKEWCYDTAGAITDFYFPRISFVTAIAAGYTFIANSNTVTVYYKDM